MFGVNNADYIFHVSLFFLNSCLANFEPFLFPLNHIILIRLQIAS